MDHETVTLVLDGDDIRLGDFAKAVVAFASILEGLRADICKKDQIEVYVDSLAMGSTIATGRCVGDPMLVGELVEHYEIASKAFKQTRKTGFSARVDNEYKKIAKLINGDIHSARFETKNVDVEIDASQRNGQDDDAQDTSISAVQGRIETIARHRGLRFTLYELHCDKSVSCYLVPGSDETMREVWGRLAIVSGIARRDPKTGRITTLRQVRDVEVIPEVTPEECLSIIGVYQPDVDESPEQTIRRLRDAEAN